MHISTIALFVLAISICAFFRSTQISGPARFPHLKGWQKLFGVLAFIIVFLMAINPEFLALGLVGDTVFFDAFVLLLSLQLQMITVQVWRCGSTVFSNVMRVAFPRLRISFAILLLIFAPITDVLAAIQKAVHRIVS